MKARIVWLISSGHCYECGGYLYPDDATDWEEVTEEEYLLLKRNIVRLAEWDTKDRVPVLIAQDEQKLPERIKQIKETLKSIEEKKKKEQEEKEKKRIQRELKQKAKAEADRKKMYEELKKEFD
jgi:2C-methyl-D-erythritol 2,4-cyclodiphosphate synthase